MSLPRVSVIVPVYNAQATLEACLRSIVSQDYPADALQVLVVDNGSSDASADIIGRYRHRIEGLDEPTRGPAAARNRGVRSAIGEVIAFIDADCIADPGWLRHLVAPLANEAVGIAGGRILSMRPCNPVEAFGEHIHDHEKALTAFRPPYAIGMNWASRRSVLLEVGLFDESFRRPAGEDVDLAYRIVQRGYALAYADRAVVRHRNEHRLRGLFVEGFRHGFHAVHVHRKHAAFLAAHGYRRVSRHRYAVLATAVRDLIAGRGIERARCVAVFDGGKALGRIAGSLRFRTIAL